MKNTVLTSLSLVLVGEDVICEGFSPLCVWVSDRMVPILLRVLCSSGHVKAKEVGGPPGILCGRWGLAILLMVGHILNLVAKPFWGGVLGMTM